MALEGEERSYIVGLVVGMLGTAPSSALMAELTAVYTGSRSLSDLADHIAASDVYISKHSRGQTVKEVAADILDSAIVGGILTGDLRTSVIDLIAGGLTAGTYTIASASKAVVDYLSNTANNDNADFGDIAKAFQNRKEVAEAYTVKITLAGIDSTPAELAAAIEGVTSDAATLTAAAEAVDDAAAEAAAVAAAEAAAVAAAAAAAQKALDDAAAEAAAVTGRQSVSFTLDIGSPAGGLGDDIIFAPQSVATNETLFAVGDQNGAATDMREQLTVDGSINIVLSKDSGATEATAGSTVISDIAIKLVGTLDING